MPGTTSTSSIPGADVPRRVALGADDGSGVEIAFFGDEGRSLFGVTHTPARPNGKGVVICSPTFNDLLKNNRREVLLSRLLASRGFAVQRFHYTGMGNSDGDASALTIDSMTDDTTRALEHLQSRADLDHVTFMGTRLAALPAARLAREAGAPLVLWEPTDVAKYFRELLRGVMIIEMGGEGGATVADLKQEFEATGSLEAAGFAIGWDLSVDSAGGVAEEVGDGDAPIFLAQFRQKPELRAEYAKLAERWRGQGRSFTEHHFLVDEAWMLFVYGFTAEEDRALSQELIEATAAFVDGAAAEGAS